MGGSEEGATEGLEGTRDRAAFARVRLEIMSQGIAEETINDLAVRSLKGAV